MLKLLKFGNRLIHSTTNEVVFFLNGNEVRLGNLDSELCLSEWLRNNFYTGVKISCESGVCGSCTVVEQFKDLKGDLQYKTINSCKFPLYHCDGKHILTPEVSEEGDSLYNQLQTHMAGNNGSQCGFCSPGVMMTIYSEILNNPGADEMVIDQALNNNQCRCTGYRPILAAIQDVLKSPDLKDVIPYPSELDDFQISDKTVELEDGTKWTKPADIGSFIESFHSQPDSTVISGGIESCTKNSNHLVDTSYVKEFQEITKSDSSFFIGSSISLEDLAVFCQSHESENPIFEALNECLQRLATKQIRNMGSAVGNLFSKDFPPELPLVLASVDAKVQFVDPVSHDVMTHSVRDLIKGRSFDCIVVTGIEVPLLKSNELLMYKKVAGRYFASLPIISGCFHMEYDESSGEINDCHFLYSGLLNENRVFRAINTKLFLEGKSLNDDTVRSQAMDILNEEMKELSDEYNYADGKVEYRQTLILSLMKKFFQTYDNKVLESLDPRSQSSLSSLVKSQPLKTKVKFEEVMQGSLHGKSMENYKSLLLSSGKAEFVDDIPKFQNELVSYIVTSPVPHGKITRIDDSAVLSSSGVHAFVTAKHIEKRGGSNLFGCTGVLDEEMLASEYVQAVGQPIAIIVAESLQQAKDAAEKLVLEIDELPAMITIEDAIREHSYFPFFPQIKDGDIEKALEEAPHVIEGEFEVSGQDHAYAETHGNLCVPQDGDELLIYAATQDCGGLQEAAGRVLNLPQHKLVCKTKRMGGGFGGKQSRGGYFAILNALACQEVGRPTRLVFGRGQDMSITGGRHTFLSKYKVGFDDSGRISALWLDLYNNGGYCTELTWAIMDKAVLCMDNAYKIDNQLVSAYCCKTNTVSNTAFRGFGAPQGQTIMEEVVERVGHYLGMDQYELRSINMYEEGDETAYGYKLNDCHLKPIWEKLHEEFDYPAKVREIEEFNAKNKYRKRGIHIMPAKCGMGYCDAPFLNAGASLVHIYKDGTVLVSIGGTEMGQGLFSKVAQVTASQFDLSLEMVNVIETSTDKTAVQPPTAASIGSDVFGGATVNACEILMDRLKPVMEDLGYPEKASWSDVVLNAWLRKVNLSAHGYYEMYHIEGCHWEEEYIGEKWREMEPKKGDPFPYLVYGGCATEVEVDCLTGETRMLRVDLIEDAGDSINPLIDIGQVEGSFVQGMGYCTTEEVVMGGPVVDWVGPGQTYNDSFLKYQVPLCHDIPEEFNVSLHTDCGTKWHESFMSSKTSGEPPFFFGQSVFFAIRNAVLDYRCRELEISDNSNDNFVFNLPATTESIRMACADDLLKMVVDTESFKRKAHV